ncbi:MAG: beta-ketoacyl synthase N-terminal-like domain-containing protein, partial [Candidatus Limnocylindrales bacterium]
VAHLAEVLQVESRTIDVREPFARYGLTSVEAVGLSGDLEMWLGRRLSPTLAYDYPSIEALARRLSAGEAGQQDGEAQRSDPNEPIAIVGLGCRLPGASDPDALWRLLRNGVDATGEVPADRWPIDDIYDADPDAPGKMSTRRGGFLDRVDGFDADFFRIAAREAIRMDPQQRLLLEVSWEALEDAGQDVDGLAGSKTGVFMGICSADYARLHLTSGDVSQIDAYSGTGVAFSIAIGRISYVLGLQGPNLAVDTSCSSSLVAIHLACQSLRSGESSLALAGGVNMMLSPETSIFLSKARALAPDGRCKTFDAAADGYARGEGCGVVVLKRLSDALVAGDRVLALIRGSAVNHDGRSNGLTAPNGPSQEAVVRDALTRAGVEPRDVGYVEAHGTGTALGDPIEVQALA